MLEAVSLGELSDEVDAVWKRQQRERKQKELNFIPAPKKNIVSAYQAEMGKEYTICVEEFGEEKFVKAEFLTRGRREFLNLVFFRRVLKGGKVLIHGIANYSLVKESHYEPHERD